MMDCDFTECERTADYHTSSGRRFCEQHAHDLVSFAFVDRDNLTEL